MNKTVNAKKVAIIEVDYDHLYELLKYTNKINKISEKLKTYSKVEQFICIIKRINKVSTKKTKKIINKIDNIIDSCINHISLKDFIGIRYDFIELKTALTNIIISSYIVNFYKQKEKKTKLSFMESIIYDNYKGKQNHYETSYEIWLMFINSSQYNDIVVSSLKKLKTIKDRF